MLKTVQIRGLRNLSDFKADLTSPFVLLTGPVGSGKTTVLDAVRLGLDLPTKFGDRGLEALSRTGEWAVTLELDGGRRLTRRLTRDGSGYEVNGRAANKVGFATACRKVFDLEPFHVELNSFIELSGAKRAELFSNLLVGEQTTLGAALKEGVGDLAALKDELFGNDAKYINPTIPMDLSGSPTMMLDWLKAASNEATQAERNAKRFAEELERQAPAKTAMSRSEADAKLQAANVRLGEISAKTKEMADRKRAQEAATSMITSAGQRLGKLKTDLAAAKELAGKLAGFRELLAKEEAGQAAVAERHKAALEAEVAAKQAYTAFVDVKPVDRPAVVDESVLQEVADAIAVKFAGMTIQAPHAIEVVKAVMEGIETTLKGIADSNRLAWDKWQTETNALGTAVKQAAEKTYDVFSEMNGWNKTIENSKALVASATTAEIRAVELQRDLDSGEAELIEMQRKVQDITVTETVETLAAEEQAVKATREQAQAAIREHERQKGYAGQVEKARVDQAVATGVKTLYGAILARMEDWRNLKMQKASMAITGPFTQLLSSLMDDAKVMLFTDGTGRSTQFELTVNRAGHPVKLEHLSGGETALAGAAFLACLQGMKQDTKRLLLTDLEALDEPSLYRMLVALPKLGFDFVMVATNRAIEFPSDWGWQVVKMGQA